MKPSRLETTCSVTVDLIALDMFPLDEADAGGVHAVPCSHPSPGITYRRPCHRVNLPQNAILLTGSVCGHKKLSQNRGSLQCCRRRSSAPQLGDGISGCIAPSIFFPLCSSFPQSVFL